ncbi:MAG: hypothetical protein J3Q66DRAFT_412575 [Benniella sp.]|nr:MAG: hypothetical protein J3Q66DRAFT_412575 [Benniella sp.]
MYPDGTSTAGSGSRTDETLHDDGPTVFFLGDLFSSPDLEFATAIPSQVLPSHPTYPLQQSFASPQLDICGEHQDLQLLHWPWLQRQQLNLTSQTIMQPQRNYGCAPQQHSSAVRPHDEPLSQIPSPTSILDQERSILAPVSTPLFIDSYNASFPQQYVVQEAPALICIDPMNRWDFRSPFHEPLSSPEEGFLTSEDQEYFNGSLEDGKLSPMASQASDDLSAARLDVPGSIGLPMHESSSTTGLPYLDSSSSTTTEQFEPFTDSESEESIVPAKKKRFRRPAKNQSPQIKLKCGHPNCNVTCSSYPSLDRHQQTHKWRGIYAPVRCEACQRDLSNEYSVQRHIRRSQVGSRCRRMRVYSVMRSRTEVETTVRFYPKRPHGKKTVAINLDEARAQFFSTPVSK